MCVLHQPRDLPPAEAVIGYVTTGGYSNTRGRSVALAVCSVRGLWEAGVLGAAPFQATVAVRNADELVSMRAVAALLR